jgi:hypothetical protein
MYRLDLKPTYEIYRDMINFPIKMEDFKEAYQLLASLDEKKIMPTAGMYNSIVGGCFRERNVRWF